MAYLAVFGVIIVTFLWGSWFQTVKHIGDFPVHAFITVMYALSIPIVWVSIWLLKDTSAPDGVFAEIRRNPGLAAIILCCGIVFGIAMQLQLTCVKKVGLILSTSVSATCSIMGGTVVSMVFAGIPKGVPAVLFPIAAGLLIVATILCQYAGVKRDYDKDMQKSITKSRFSDIMLLAFINLILMSSYPLATSLGIRTALNPHGFSSLTCMGVIVMGAFTGAFTFTVISLWRKKEGLREMRGVRGKKIVLLAGIAAVCHFGGNVLHSVCAPVVSVAIATVLGNSYHCWSYVWGLAYGEFKGASAKTYGLLFAGILVFVVGVLLISAGAI